MIVPVFMMLGVVGGLLLVANPPTASQSQEAAKVLERQLSQPHQNHRADNQKQHYANQQKQAHPETPAKSERPEERRLLEQAKKLVDSGADKVMMEQSIAILENEIEKAKEHGQPHQDALNARSFLLGKLKNHREPSFAQATQEARELRVAMGEAMA